MHVNNTVCKSCFNQQNDIFYREIAVNISFSWSASQAGRREFESRLPLHSCLSTFPYYSFLLHYVTIARVNLLLGQTEDELIAFAQGLGEKPFRGKQLYQALYTRRTLDLNTITALANARTTRKSWLMNR